MVQGYAYAGVHNTKDIREITYNDNMYGIQFHYFNKENINVHPGKMCYCMIRISKLTILFDQITMRILQETKETNFSPTTWLLLLLSRFLISQHQE